MAPAKIAHIEGLKKAHQMVYMPEIKQSVVVHHPKFGQGKVVVRYGEDENSKVIVKFQEEGEKKLALQHAKLVADIPEPEEEGEEGEAPK